jgi:hypothetical protein
VSLFCLSSPCILCNQGCQCLCFVFLHTVSCVIKAVSVLVLFVTQDTEWRKTKQRHWQPWLHKIQGEDKQNKDTGNLDYTRYRVKTNKTNNTGNLDYTIYSVKKNKTKTLATLITQDTGWRQTKQITLATLITQDTVWRQIKQRHWQP